MIKLYAENEKIFTSQGLGVLSDVIECVVNEELNGVFELEMTYPINGRHYIDIELRRFIFAKPNMYDSAQPFRIYEITKPIDGIVTVYAQHISYDLTGYIIRPFTASDLLDVLNKLSNDTVLPSPFIFGTDKSNVVKEYVTKGVYNLRSLLFNGDSSLVENFKGEYKFDMFNVNLLDSRGSNKGVILRYGKNLTELEQSIRADKLYTGIYPFYSKKITETRTYPKTYYKEYYIVTGATPYHSGWLSSTEGGEPIMPTVADVPVKIVSEGAYKDKIVLYLPQTLISVYIRESGIELESSWFSLTEDGDALTPEEMKIYSIKNEGETKGDRYIWNGAAYVKYEGFGFYSEPEITPPPIFTTNVTESFESEIYLDLTTGIDCYIQEGMVAFGADWLVTMEGGNVAVSLNDALIYIVKTEGDYKDKKYKWNATTEIFEEFTGNGLIFLEGFDENSEPQKILNLDLSSQFSDIPTVETLLAKANDYLANNNLREITNELTVSFIKLSDSDEYKHFAELEKVMLGDIISVKYEKLGVDSLVKVLSTEYNVIQNKYNEIELGKVKDNLESTVVVSGSNVSTLVNDAEYTDEVTAKKIVTEKVTSSYIEAQNAVLTQAQIEQLQVMSIKIPGILEASYGTIDEIVSKLLQVDNAEVRKVLTAGDLKLSGDITMNSGEIKIKKLIDENDVTDAYIVADSEVMSDGWLSLTDGGAALDPTINPDTIYIIKSESYYKGIMYKINSDTNRYEMQADYVYKVDRLGNVTANALRITGGTIKIGDKFNVTNDGVLTASGVKIINGDMQFGPNGYEFKISNDGIIDAYSFNINNGIIENLTVTDILESEDIAANRIYISKDKTSYLYRATVAGMDEEHTITFNIVSSVERNAHNTGNKATVVLTASSTDGNGPWEDKSINVIVTYTDLFDIKRSIMVPLTLSAGSLNTSGSAEDTLANVWPKNVPTSHRALPVAIHESRNTSDEHKLMLHTPTSEIDIVGGIVDLQDAVGIKVSNTEPDTSELPINTVWFDIDPS